MAIQLERRRLPVVVSAVLAVLAAAVATAPGIPPLVRGVAGWGIAAGAAVLAARTFARAGAYADGPRLLRTFWRRLSGTAMITTAGLVVAGAAPLGLPYLREAELGIFGVAILLLCVAVWGLPATPRAGYDWLTFGLDSLTVLVAAALFAWHFTLRQLLADPNAGEHALLGIALLGAVSVYVVVRVGLAWAGPVDQLATALLGMGLLVGILSGALLMLPFVADATQLLQLGVPAAAVLWVAAARRQLRVVPGRHHRKHSAHRPFSLLPYSGVVAVGTLLLVEGPDAGREGRIIVTGAVVLVTLVLVRQLAAFYENARLLRRLDASMQEVRNHERRFRSMVQQASDIIVITSPDGTVSYASPALRQLIGVAPDEAEQLNLTTYIHPDDAQTVADQTREVAGMPGSVATYRVRLADANGTYRWLEFVSTNLLADPSVRGIVSNARDITDMLRYQQQLTHQATHDELTKLPNRALLLERLEGALAPRGTDVNAGRISVALVDLDDFKAFNDRLGHPVGDGLLVGMGRILSRAVGPHDTVARLGGDEFAVLMVGVTPEKATEVINRIITALETPMIVDGYELLVGASIGLAHGHAGEDPAELLRRADVALYAAKDHGKGRFAAYDLELDRRSVQHAELGAELRQALGTYGQLHLLYQPIVTLPDGLITGVEALIRWQHPRRGLIPPSEFIPVAERTGLIVPLGRWILREAAAQAAAWANDPTAAPITMSVNVSARQLREPGFPEELSAVLAETGLEPSRFIVEVTETAVFDSDAALTALRGVSRLGVRVALDDFGTGHSSLGLLRTCPVDVLKVDKSFVDGVTGTAEQAAIAISLIQITTTMRLAAVAEGVETADQARVLHDLGYRLAQGYHFSRPASPEQIHQMLAVASAERYASGASRHRAA
ncbi:putative bifunctional diguanylate cyclase/phosphodiesterase [Pilimelia anulata]|uniref:putative bifunctional diguanylate cyclase/phosphodiesterase n=1 Tax=Pilimelia anulata TaxID=53371 RepID=UPI00166AAE54|nr:EAL domain-containing protein [Pilimelia anulata]